MNGHIIVYHPGQKAKNDTKNGNSEIKRIIQYSGLPAYPGLQPLFSHLPSLRNTQHEIYITPDLRIHNKCFYHKKAGIQDLQFPDQRQLHLTH